MEFVNTAWALLPPIVAIVLALITKETYTSLFIGILVGGLLVAGFMPVATLNTIINWGAGEDLAHCRNKRRAATTSPGPPARAAPCPPAA